MPLNRNIGIDIEVISAPMEEAKNLYYIDAIQIVNAYNEDFEIESIEFEEDYENGRIKPKVVITYAE